jgi:phage terminase small subunit
MNSMPAKCLAALNHYMRGMTKKAAMAKAGYSKSMCTTNTAHVFDREDVLLEMERRRGLASKRSDVDMDWIIDRLKSIADANVVDLLDVYSDGSVELNLEYLTPDLKRSIGGLNVDTVTEGRGTNARKVKRIKITSADKLRALELLIRHLGLSKEKITVEGEVSLVDRLNAGRARVAKAQQDNNEEAE